MYTTHPCSSYGTSQLRWHGGWRLTLASLLCVAVLCPVAWSQVPYGRSAAADPPLQQLILARGELRDTESALTELTQRLKTRLEASDPQWAGLCHAARDTTAERDRIHEATLAAARARPEYLAAEQSLAKAEAKMSQLTDARDTASREFARADELAFALRNRIREMEASALRDSEELRAAELRATNARQSMEVDWERYASEVLEQNATWVQAVQRRDGAAAAVKQAETAFTASRRLVATSSVRSSGTHGSHGSRNSSNRGSSRSGGNGRNSYGSSGSGHNNSRSNRSSYR